MVEKKSLTLYWTKNGNTEKVARRIHDTLVEVGIEDSIYRMTKDLQVEPVFAADQGGFSGASCFNG